MKTHAAKNKINKYIKKKKDSKLVPEGEVKLHDPFFHLPSFFVFLNLAIYL